MQVYELNLDGLVGPTHHYAGLGVGNTASINHALEVANPQAAALEGLKKMRLLYDMGLKQAFLPPHPRPNLSLLNQLGFTGNLAQQLAKAQKEAPRILSAAFSSAGMWTANAATVSASNDSLDKRVQFTAANLISSLHRQQEALFSQQLLKKIFANPLYFNHHLPLPDNAFFSDEGAANANRLCASHQNAGISLFVYGKSALNRKFPARQTLEASEAIARTHQLDFKKVIFACQHPKAIDAGVFHNDVIALANENLFLVHEHAFLKQKNVLTELKKKADFPLHILEISEKQLPLKDAVATYFFNAQLITTNDNKMVLIAPYECAIQPKTQTLIQNLIDDDTNPITEVHYCNLKQSMQNGGGPACLRLRIILNQHELDAMQIQVLITPEILNTLELWVKRHYRTRLQVQDLSDPLFTEEVFCALDELTMLLDLGPIYPFQRE